jgi:histone-lysine N-methyltransferase SETMAR
VLTAMVILEFLAKKHIKLLSHPPYSPDLTPADYFLFPKLKKEKGRASP